MSPPRFHSVHQLSEATCSWAQAYKGSAGASQLSPWTSHQFITLSNNNSHSNTSDFLTRMHIFGVWESNGELRENPENPARTYECCKLLALTALPMCRNLTQAPKIDKKRRQKHQKHQKSYWRFQSQCWKFIRVRTVESFLAPFWEAAKLTWTQKHSSIHIEACVTSHLRHDFLNWCKVARVCSQTTEHLHGAFNVGAVWTSHMAFLNGLQIQTSGRNVI